MNRVHRQSVPTAFGGSGAAPDCIAVCAPGSIISIVVFVERIVIKPEASPDDAAHLEIRSEEVYDFLMRAENQPVDKLLFVTPHRLFTLQDASNTFAAQVKAPPLTARGGGNWHWPVEPIQTDNRLEIALHDRKGTAAFQRFSGTIGSSELAFPPAFSEEAALPALFGLRRTVFECSLRPPLQPGEARWFRIQITPVKLTPPAPPQASADDGSGIPLVSQLLDILGPDTMLECLRNALVNMIKAPQLPKELRAQIEPKEIQSGLGALHRYVFAQGFDLPGTYTRYEDHRVILAPHRCRINLIAQDGSVALQGVVPLPCLQNLCYYWLAGLADNSDIDPISVAERVHNYLHTFSPDESAAKHKALITYVTQSEHILGCRIIDKLTVARFLNRKGDSFWAGPEKLPEDAAARRAALIRIVERLLADGTPPQRQAQFRILYEALWCPAGKAT